MYTSYPRLSTLCVRRVAWGTRTLRRRGRSSFSACFVYRWRQVRRAATWACDTLPSQRSGHGRRGSKSKATSAADAWALSRARRKVRWPGHGHWPVARTICRARGSRLRAIQVLSHATLACAPSCCCSSQSSLALTCCALRSQTISSRRANSPYAFSPARKREHLGSDFVGQRCKRRAALRRSCACPLHVQRTIFDMRCSDGSATAARPAFATRRDRCDHGRARHAAAMSGRDWERADVRAARACAAALLWINCG